MAAIAKGKMARTLHQAWRDSKEHGNNFDALRLVAALAVILSHAPLTTLGHPYSDPFYQLMGTIGTGDLGLLIFFIVSGFLITKSWQSDPFIKRFLMKRFLRIIPALTIVVLLSVFVFGPALSSLSTGEYFGDADTYRYLANIYMDSSQPALPGVFDGAPLSDAFNAPLWTIGIEVSCYTLILLLGCAGFLKGTKPGPFSSAGLCGAIALLLYPLVTFAGDINLGAFQFLDKHFVVLTTAFLVGAVFALCDQFIALKVETAIIFLGFLVLLASIGKMISLPIDMLVLIFGVFGAYLIFYLAFANLGRIKNVGASGDYSYGLYLWAWPVQQIVASAFPANHWTANLALTLPIVFGFAYLSWHLIERPALQLKPKKTRNPHAGAHLSA